MTTATDRFAETFGWALHYAVCRRKPVFPCNPEDKSPKVKGGFKAATLEPEQIFAWDWSNSLIGIPTGERSGWVVVDVDIREGGNGMESFQHLSGWLHPETLTAYTPSGGMHLFFAHPGQEVQ